MLACQQLFPHILTWSWSGGPASCWMVCALTHPRKYCLLDLYDLILLSQQAQKGKLAQLHNADALRDFEESVMIMQVKCAKRF